MLHRRCWNDAIETSAGASVSMLRHSSTSYSAFIPRRRWNVLSTITKTYEEGIKHYSHLCDHMKAQPMPATEPLLCIYVTYLANCKIH